MIYGRCQCKNIELVWRTISTSLIPRACQCDYCKSKNASYVSEPGTEFRATIHYENNHKIIRHGTESADFHECKNCKKIVFATSEIDNIIYGVINSECIENKDHLKESQPYSYEGETLEERLRRRQKNWCSPVIINPGTDHDLLGC